MKKLYMILSIALILFSTGCEESSTKESITVYTTNYAQKFILESIGQEYVDAYSVYDNSDEFDIKNAEEFTYEAKDPITFMLDDYPDLKEKILEADMFIYNGRSDKDTAILNDLVDDTKSENLPIFDSTKNADISTVEKTMALSYNNKVVDSSILDAIFRTDEAEMFWLSPIEMQNVSAEIYSFLVEAMPSKKSYFEDNLDALMFDLDSLYANIESMSSRTLNNMIVSDSIELSVIKIHYIENIYVDYELTDYMEVLSNYITIEDSLTISTTDPNSENYFDLAEVQSPENYENGMRYYEIMSENYKVLEKVLQ